VSARRNQEPPAISPLGDSAVIVRPGEVGDAPGESATEAVMAALRNIKRAGIAGVLEVTPAYMTVAVFYDSLGIKCLGGESVFQSLNRQLTAALEANPPARAGRGKRVEIPVCYEGDFALDLETVAKQCGLAPAEVIARHSRAAYVVACIGFTPGFPYLLGLPEELAVPRRASPRTAVPAGSVAIGGNQTGVYPQSSPGGWHVIGRAPRRLFDATKDPPVLLCAGDRVRFRQISRKQFEEIAAGAKEFGT
jgi:inhibitor of KinA